jgi:death-on-curing protein
MIWLPSIDQVIEMHSILIRRTGGSDGIRNLGLIESALARASAGYEEYERYPSVKAKAAAIAHGLGSNHGFIDGNKRVGIAVMLLILRKNNVQLSYTQQELILLGLDIATDCVNPDGIIAWIEAHTR